MAELNAEDPELAEDPAAPAAAAPATAVPATAAPANGPAPAASSDAPATLDNVQLHEQMTLLTAQMQEMMKAVGQLASQNTVTNAATQPTETTATVQDDTSYWQQSGWDSSWRTGANWWDSAGT